MNRTIADVLLRNGNYEGAVVAATKARETGRDLIATPYRSLFAMASDQAGHCNIVTGNALSAGECWQDVAFGMCDRDLASLTKILENFTLCAKLEPGYLSASLFLCDWAARICPYNREVRISKYHLLLSYGQRKSVREVAKEFDRSSIVSVFDAMCALVALGKRKESQNLVPLGISLSDAIEQPHVSKRWKDAFSSFMEMR